MFIVLIDKVNYPSPEVTREERKIKKMKFMDFYKKANEDSNRMFIEIEREAKRKKKEVFESFKNSVCAAMKDVSFEECISVANSLENSEDKAFVLTCYNEVNKDLDGKAALICAMLIMSDNL